MKRQRGAANHTLIVEIAAEREHVWRALTGELNVRGSHVRIEAHVPPEHLRLLLRPRAGELQTLDYRLAELDGATTTVTATVHTAGTFYLLKRVLTLGRIDAEYLHAVAVGLANLQRYVEEPEQEHDGDEPD